MQREKPRPRYAFSVFIASFFCIFLCRRCLLQRKGCAPRKAIPARAPPPTIPSRVTLTMSSLHLQRNRKKEISERGTTRAHSVLLTPPPIPHNNKNPIIHQAAPSEIKVKSKPVKQEKANKKGAADEAGEAIAKGKGKH